MQVSAALLAMADTVFPAHHACRVLLAIATHHAPPALWATPSMLEAALNALLLAVCAAITPPQPYAPSVTVILISTPAPTYASTALVLAAAAKPQPSAQTASMATSCKPSTT